MVAHCVDIVIISRDKAATRSTLEEASVLARRDVQENLLLRLFMDGTRFTVRVSDLTVQGVTAAADRSSRDAKDNARNDEARRTHDHQDEADGGEAKSGALISHRPIHDGPDSD